MFPLVPTVSTDEDASNPKMRLMADRALEGARFPVIRQPFVGIHVSSILGAFASDIGVRVPRRNGSAAAAVGGGPSRTVIGSTGGATLGLWRQPLQ